MKTSRVEPICCMRTDRRKDMTNLIAYFGSFAKAANNFYNIELFTFCVAEIRLCVLQTAVASLQSADCDTEWLIGINLVTGGVLCTKGIVRI